jgi:tRNA 2-thiouridine synthesizing protein A
MLRDTLDTSGTVCPMPAFKTRAKLKTMETGDELVVTGDFLPAVENITRIAVQNGGKIVKSTVNGSIFELLIRKIA